MKKLFTIILASLLVLALFAGCAKDNSGESKTIITVPASTTPHAEILEQCKASLEADGYTLDIKMMDDYVIPNTATEGGDVDANYFQHQPYLDQFNEENKTHLVTVAKIHYEPYGIYAGTTKSLEDLPEGASRGQGGRLPPPARRQVLRESPEVSAQRLLRRCQL